MTDRTRLSPHFLGDPAGDPALLVEIEGERSSILIDCGDLGTSSTSTLRRISTILLSHHHIDHTIGFDTYLRNVLHADQTVEIYGPPGTIETIGNRLLGYTWNLSTELQLVFVVHDLEDQICHQQRFRLANRFQPETPTQPIESERPEILPLNPALPYRIRCATLDHAGIPSLAYRIDEIPFINFNNDQLQVHGYRAGPWLQHLTQAIRDGRDPSHPLETDRGPRALEELIDQFVQITPGRSLVYVTDTGPTPNNFQKIRTLAAQTDLLFCEHYFSSRESDRASRFGHLTASQAGQLARESGAQKLIGFHHSPRYQGEVESLLLEGQIAMESGTQPSGGERLATPEDLR